MTGEDRATLQGFAIPLAPAMDHTYVASSCGLRWGCFGRDDNGAMICTGSGSSKLANCLSQVDSRASIIYGITGVCHQAANRILHPARLTVALAGGFQHSVFVFGVYGSGWPEKLFGCLSPPGGGGGPPNGSGVERAPPRLNRRAARPHGFRTSTSQSQWPTIPTQKMKMSGPPN
jgi:hypothetical protein